VNRSIDRLVPDPGACRILAEEVIAFPVLRGSDRPWHKPAAAIGADIAQDMLNASSAKRTFISTYAGIKRGRGQGLVAVFAGRSEFEHFWADGQK
jgi:hypothetical protein